MRLPRRLLIAVLVTAALAPTASAAARKPAKSIKAVPFRSFSRHTGGDRTFTRLRGIFHRTLPEETQGTSVTLGPGGIPWFGTRTLLDGGLTLAHVKSHRLSVVSLCEATPEAVISSPRFDPTGTLWYVVSEGEGIEETTTIGRRAPDGVATTIDLPAGPQINALAIGPEGNVWFTRGAFEEAGAIGRLTPAGAVTEFPIAPGSFPTSIVAGPDGALWFVESYAGAIGRIAPNGEVRTFALGRGVEPREIVAGADGALWFSENGAPAAGHRTTDRIGRITTSGEVTQFPIPFGEGTIALAADPRGPIWFTTEKRELASISTSGTLGRRGCLATCTTPIVSLAVTAGGVIWFATGTEYCGGCGGGSDLILANEPTEVGRIPPGALRPPAGSL